MTNAFKILKKYSDKGIEVLLEQAEPTQPHPILVSY